MQEEKLSKKEIIEAFPRIYLNRTKMPAEWRQGQRFNCTAVEKEWMNEWIK